MKTSFVLTAAAILTATAWLIATRRETPATVSPAAALADPPSVVKNDAIRIFQQTLWRSPAAGDHILHAERREWRDADGLSKWQNFLVLEPSPELLKYLRDDNAFGLAPIASPLPVEHAPPWFHFRNEAVTVLKAPQGRKQFAFSKDSRLLYVFDADRGLTKPVTAGPGLTATP